MQNTGQFWQIFDFLIVMHKAANSVCPVMNSKMGQLFVLGQWC